MSRSPATPPSASAARPAPTSAPPRGARGRRGLVIENATDRVEGPEPNGAGFKVRAASGVSFAALARRLSFAGYSGLEWACGIPGTLGGAAVYNAGAYGRSLVDVLKRVRLW